MNTDARKLIEEIGAKALKDQDGHFSVELQPLSLVSVFSKPIKASAQIELLSQHAFCFHSPPAMKALGPLWVEGLDRKSQLISAIQDAIYRLKRRLDMRV